MNSFYEGGGDFCRETFFCWISWTKPNFWPNKYKVKFLTGESQKIQPSQLGEWNLQGTFFFFGLLKSINLTDLVDGMLKKLYRNVQPLRKPQLNDFRSASFPFKTVCKNDFQLPSYYYVTHLRYIHPLINCEIIILQRIAKDYN